MISIHALREEGDRNGHRHYQKLENFYPRPPRGGRPICTNPFVQLFVEFLSTPSARRATLWRSAASYLLSISIHALREEGDAVTIVSGQDEDISIHALREEGDTGFVLLDMIACYFYPRPPRGGRQLRSATLSSRSVFLSTPSARRATLLQTPFIQNNF